MAKQEEKLEMRKKIAEMRDFFEVYGQKQKLAADVAAQEERIARLRGVTRGTRGGDDGDSTPKRSRIAAVSPAATRDSTPKRM